MLSKKEIEELRRKTEVIINEFNGEKHLTDKNYSMVEIIRDLQAYQVELEKEFEKITSSQTDNITEDKYKELFEHSPVGIIIFDDEGKILGINETGSSLLELSKNDIINKPFSEFLTTSGIDKFNLHLQVVFLTDETQSCELSIIGKDNREKFILLESEAHSENGNNLCWTAISDISSKRKSENKLKENKFTLQTILDNSSEAIFIVDNNFQFVEANSTALDLLALSFKELLELDLKKIISPADETSEKSFWQNLFKGKTKIGECLLNKNNSETLYAEFKVVPEFTADSNLLFLNDISKQKESELQIQHSEKSFKDILENIKLAAVILDTEGNITYCNNFLQKLTGCSSTELENKNWFDNFVPEHDREKLRENFKRIISSDNLEPYYESEIQTRDKNIRTMAWNNAVVKDASGKITGITSIGEDITEQKIAEEKLKSSEARFSKSFYYSPIPLSIIRVRDRKLIDVNRSFVIAGGFKSAEDVIGKTSQELSAWKNPEQRDKVFNTIMEKGSIINEEVSFIAPGGKIIHVLLSSFLIDIDNEPCIQSAFYDITERIQTLELLKQSEEEYRMLFESAYDAILIFNAEKGNILEANDAAARLFNKKKTELISKPAHELFKGNIFGTEHLQQIVEREKASHLEAVHQDLQGKEIFLEINASKIYYRGKEAIIAIERDVTDRKATENKINNYIHDLENSKNVIEKNAEELAKLNNKLLESEKQLTRLNLDKDKFFSIIAHDLRSPFASLLGFAEYLHNELNNLSKKELEENFDNIYRSAKGVFNLLDNLLQWSRIQTGRIEYSPSAFVFNTILDAAFEVYNITAENKKVKLVNKLNSNFKVYADSNMVEAVLRNLISNAIKFSNRGNKIKLTAKTEEGMLKFSVEDNGVGMKEEDIQKVFDISSHKSTLGTEGEEGTGLGLILCKDFIKMNGGNIWIESKVDKGTIVRFTLPLAK